MIRTEVLLFGEMLVFRERVHSYCVSYVDQTKDQTKELQYSFNENEGIDQVCLWAWYLSWERIRILAKLLMTPSTAIANFAHDIQVAITLQRFAFWMPERPKQAVLSIHPFA